MKQDMKGETKPGGETRVVDAKFVAGAVDAASLPPDVVVNRINLNDQTVEGMRHKTKPIRCVQYHPEASPGPHDSKPLFAEFRAMIEGM